MRELFNLTRTVAVQPAAPSTPSGLAFDTAGSPQPPPVTHVEREGAFVTPQSLISFAGATGAVTIIWQGIGAIHQGWGSNPTVALAISALVGLAIYLISETDPARGAVTAQQRIIGIVIALINTFVIFSAAVGTISVTQ